MALDVDVGAESGIFRPYCLEVSETKMVDDWRSSLRVADPQTAVVSDAVDELCQIYGKPKRPDERRLGSQLSAS